MLILSRTIGETLRVGEEVIVQIVEVRGDAVRIGIEAPPNVKVMREEIYSPPRPEIDRQRFSAHG